MKNIRIIKNIIYTLASIPKTLYFNFRTLPFKYAIRLPFFIGWNVDLVEIHNGIIEFICKPTMFMVRFGHGGSLTISANRSKIRLKKGKLTFNGKATFASGGMIDLNGELSFGKNLSTNRNCSFSCNSHISIGDNVLFGWDVHLFDNDGGHTILYKGNPKPVNKGSIIIGNHVWICSCCHLLKGAEIKDDSILGYRSLLNKKIDESNVLVAGIPAEIKQKEINWIQ